MRKLFPMLAMAVAAVGFSVLAQAYSGDEVKLKGYAQCAKCALKETKACQNVVVVKDKDDKEVKYYFEQNDVAKKAHQKLGFCTAPKGEGPQVAFEGECEKKDGKLMVTATKIEAAKDE
jgi:hypothetical protein